jgi:hypothetical protein
MTDFRAIALFAVLLALGFSALINALVLALGFSALINALATTL